MQKYYSDDTYEIEKPEVKDWTMDKKLNPVITDTAGFIPLDVQIQKFEQSGRRARFSSDMFDSSDYRDAYLSPDLRINPEDDEIDMQRKFELQAYVLQRIAQSKMQGEEKQSVESMTKDYERMKEREAQMNEQVGDRNTPTPPAVGADS